MDRKYTVLVTGASGEIGASIAARFAHAGHRVIFHCHTRRESVEAAVQSARSSGCSALALQADLTDAQQVLRLIEAARAHFGPVEILVNNAGSALEQKLLTDCTEAEWDALFAINLRSMFLLSRAVLPDMVDKKSGAIVNISSLWGLVGGSCEVPYSAAKAAVVGFTKALAKETAPSNIRVNCVAPGLIPSRMNAHLSDAALEAFREETPLRRLGKAADVAEAVYFLALPTASFITGQVLCVDGGMSME